MIKKLIERLRNHYVRWWREDEAVAAVEAAFILPVMLLMIIGSYDVGRAILVNQKVIAASQVGADLIARNMSVDDNIVNETIEAARQVLRPYPTESFGIDIVSLRFDENDLPEELWRRTENMEPNQVAVNSTGTLFPEGEGVVIVTVEYSYTPTFGDYVIGGIRMSEVAFSRGRRSATVCPCP